MDQASPAAEPRRSDAGDLSRLRYGALTTDSIAPTIPPRAPRPLPPLRCQCRESPRRGKGNRPRSPAVNALRGKTIQLMDIAPLRQKLYHLLDLQEQVMIDPLARPLA